MAYCLLADIQSLMAMTFTTTSRPTTTEVNTAIDTVSAELDGVAAAAGYDLPITNASALELLKRYAIFGAAVSAWHTGFVGDDEPARVTWWNDQYQNFLSRLRRGEQLLPGEVVDDEETIAFAIAPHPQRDRYWSTGEVLDA